VRTRRLRQADGPERRSHKRDVISSESNLDSVPFASLQQLNANAQQALERFGRVQKFSLTEYPSNPRAYATPIRYKDTNDLTIDGNDTPR